MEKILKKLVSFKTITENQKENRAALDWVEKQVGRFLTVKRFESNGYPSLIASAANSKPKLILAAHIDVVGAGEEMFTPRQNGRKLFGRGVFDMKFAIACYLKLIQEIKGQSQKYDFGLAITSDEEKGGLNGTKFLLEKILSPEFVFLPDGGRNWHIETGSKAVWQLEISAGGKSAHGSRPWEGKNPVFPLFKFLQELDGLFAPEPCQDKNHYHDTFNIGKIDAGQAANQVPRSAKAIVDIRLLPETDRDKLWKNIKKIQKKYSEISIREVIYSSYRRDNLAHPHIDLFCNISQKFGKERLKTIFSHGSSDARFFGEKNIPVLVMRPAGGGHHSDAEWIDVEDLKKFYRVFKEWFLIAAKKES